MNGNLSNTTNTASETVTRIYDDANRMIELTDSLNRTTHFTYDGLDRVTEVRDAAQGLTKFTFDANDNLTAVIDPNNNPVETNIYDLRNRLKLKVDAKNRSTLYDYDGAGNVIRMTDRRGRVTDYTYDALNRVTRVSDADGRITTYAYDLAGNLSRVSDTQSGDLLMSYDVLNRLKEVVTPQGTVAYGYDAIGRMTSRTLAGSDVTAYTYDRANRLKTVTLKGRTATYNYDAAGRLSDRILPNGMKVAYQYDAADRVTEMAYRNADDTPVETVTYAYDAGGQRRQRGTGASPVLETTFSASYDEANRLTAITLNGEAFTIAYDDNGNLVSRSGPVSGTTTYGWSARNQLISLSGPAGAASFKYDALGRRIEKTVNGQSTGFLYDGAQAIAELKGSSLDTVYHTGIQIDEVLARYGSAGDKTLLTDALMSVIAQVNDDQSTANFYAYSPYGETVTLGPDSQNSLQYTGRENDATGLYYYRARYYDPVLKRFVSEDPIGIAAGLNFAAYVGGDPLSNTDPTGHAIQIAGAAAIGAVIGGLAAAAQTYNSGQTGIWNYASAVALGGAAGATGGIVVGAGLSGLAATGAIGFAAGFAGNAATQLNQGGRFSLCQALVQGGIGGAAGLLGGIWGLGLAATASTASLVSAASAANQVLLNMALPINLGGLNPTLIARIPCGCP